MTTGEILLAKSRKNGRTITVQSHTGDVERSARQIFDLQKRWARNWCRFFKIVEQSEQQKFFLNLCVAALLHDIGKANSDFQTAVEKSGYRQTIRHEHLSALILHLPEVRKWLAENDDLDLEVITAAVLSHHTKAWSDGDWQWMQPKDKLSLEVFVDHQEINFVFDQIKEMANLSVSLRLNHKSWSNIEPWTEALFDGFETANTFRRSLKKDKKRLKLLLAVKAALIAADAAGSGLVREGEDIEYWINEKAHSEAIGETEVAEKIINKRAEAILSLPRNIGKKRKVDDLLASGVSFEDALDSVLWSDFQKDSANLGEKALLLAACGAGKTIAAWKWAATQTQNFELGKVIFLYPTRGTATEGFKDYVGFAPEAEASLLHGSARYELDGIAENPNEATKDKDYRKEVNERLFALGFWGKRYFSATVDQFLSFLEHGYSSLCLLPVLADSAVIIDEIHSFDNRMFESLICFLTKFHIPVLCMTATLPTSRKENLEKIKGLRVYPNSAEQAELKDLEKAEKHPRYDLEIIDNESAALKIAVEEFNKGKRVLWVVNTVKRCQRIAKGFGNHKDIQGKTKPLVYHSRFRLVDRKNRHEEAVEAFKQLGEAKIAITTQVCEMSLDLDADVLITEIAPISSLVQRFGRSNRHLARGADFRSRLIVYMPEKDKPYNQKEDLDTALTFLKDLPAKDISQRLLAEKLEQHSPKIRQSDGDFAPFLSSGYYAVPGSLREIDDFTNPCILTTDILKVKECLAQKKPIDAFVISVPKQFVLTDFEKPKEFPKYLRIADAKFYSPDWGFMTEE